jgi:hypothetical protein
MKGNPAMPGGPLTSKPTWSQTSRSATTSFFFRRRNAGQKSFVEEKGNESMTQTQQEPQHQAMEQHELETRRDVIGEQVIHLLGSPPGLFKVQVRPLWGNCYRVNIFVGADAASVRVAHSYFLKTDSDGNITAPAPKITKEY